MICLTKIAIGDTWANINLSGVNLSGLDLLEGRILSKFLHHLYNLEIST